MSPDELVDVPAEECVLRVAKPHLYDPGSNKPSSDLFALSTNDKNENPPSLSVYRRKHTSPHEARVLSNNRDGKVFSLCVRDVTALKPGVVRIIERIDPRDSRPGAKGHAGIVGLRHGNTGERRALRSELRDLARLVAE